jgi:hypothetical protein
MFPLLALLLAKEIFCARTDYSSSRHTPPTEKVLLPFEQKRPRGGQGQPDTRDFSTNGWNFSIYTLTKGLF